jgi:ribosomal protein L28
LSRNPIKERDAKAHQGLQCKRRRRRRRHHPNLKSHTKINMSVNRVNISVSAAAR